jgi:predicted ATPase
MISQFRIQRFKCFEDQEITFGNLTLLVGGNATGKSTVIQALLLLRQSCLIGGLNEGELSLNGKFTNVGTAQDALFSKSQEDSIAFSVKSQDEQDSINFKFDYPRGNPEAYTLFGTKLTGRNPFYVDVTYLNAERLGPRLIYPMTDEWYKVMNVGTQGEFTAHCLAEFGSEPINNSNLAYPDEDNISLKYQTELWMRRIVPNLDIEIERISQADRVRIGLRNQGDTNYWRPTNTGFGISYTLPIIVAALMSKPNSILIIENPEAHLHPAGQSEMGKFLARTAVAGVQVIIETHSDHILNGIRLSVRRAELQAENVSIQFFRHNDETNDYEVFTPKIDADGRIDSWPEGFFDQIERDLMELV